MLARVDCRGGFGVGLDQKTEHRGFLWVQKSGKGVIGGSEEGRGF